MLDLLVFPFSFRPHKMSESQPSVLINLFIRKEYIFFGSIQTILRRTSSLFHSVCVCSPPPVSRVKVLFLCALCWISPWKVWRVNWDCHSSRQFLCVQIRREYYSIETIRSMHSLHRMRGEMHNFSEKPSFSERFFWKT